MKFSIKDPKDDSPLLLQVVPTEYEGEQALKIVFPEMDSITMIKKNGLWMNAGETDMSHELVKAIAKGIQSHVEPNIQQQVSFKTMVLKNSRSMLLLMAGITIACCTFSNKDAGISITDSAQNDTRISPDTETADPATLTQIPSVKTRNKLGIAFRSLLNTMQQDSQTLQEESL